MRSKLCIYVEDVLENKELFNISDVQSGGWVKTSDLIYVLNSVGVLINDKALEIVAVKDKNIELDTDRNIVRVKNRVDLSLYYPDKEVMYYAIASNKMYIREILRRGLNTFDIAKNKLHRTKNSAVKNVLNSRSDCSKGDIITFAVNVKDMAEDGAKFLSRGSKEPKTIVTYYVEPRYLKIVNGSDHK